MVKEHVVVQSREGGGRREEGGEGSISCVAGHERGEVFRVPK